MQKGLKYTYDLDVFYREDALSYYLLGVFMTDGCVRDLPNRKLVGLTSKDLDWLKAIRDLICKDLPIRKENGCWELRIYSTELGKWFISKGCTSRKSLTLEFPAVPKNYLPDFLRGCMDGDGCIGLYKDKRFNAFNKKSFLCSSSSHFILEFNKVLRKRKLNYYLEVRPKGQKLTIRGKETVSTHRHYRTVLTGNNAADFLAWVYYPGHILSLPRKEQIAQKIVKLYE